MAESFEDMWVGLPSGPQPGHEDAGIGGVCTLESFMSFVPEGKDAVREVSVPEPGDEFGGMCDLESLVAGITDIDWDTVSTGVTTEIDGTPALELIAEDDRGTTRMWVATGRDNYVLKLAREDPGADEFTLGDYNDPVDVSVPDEDEILDLAGAGG